MSDCSCAAGSPGSFPRLRSDRRHRRRRHQCLLCGWTATRCGSRSPLAALFYFHNYLPSRSVVPHVRAYRSLALEEHSYLLLVGIVLLARHRPLTAAAIALADLGAGRGQRLPPLCPALQWRPVHHLAHGRSRGVGPHFLRAVHPAALLERAALARLGSRRPRRWERSHSSSPRATSTHCGSQHAPCSRR